MTDHLLETATANAKAGWSNPLNRPIASVVAVTVAALTVYDMVKAVDRGMRIEGVRLIHKSGGRSGEWNAPE